MQRMKTNSLRLYAGIVVLTACATSACNRDGNSPVDSAESRRSAAVVGKHDAVRVPQRDTARGSEEFRPPEIVCGTDQACLESPLIAFTKEEFAWLRTHGYPSPVELRNLQSTSNEGLRAKAAQGSTAAMVVLGARLVDQRNEGEGLKLLMRAADAGSVYAYYELSNANVRSPRLANHIDAAAFLRVAYILGDWKAAAEIERRFPLFGPSERLFIDERAASLYRTFANSRRPEPRPMERK